MNKTGYRVGAATTLSAFIMVALASLAWACSPQTRLYGITPIAAPRQTAVRMSGESVTPGTPVQIRWNSAKGIVLGETVADSTGRFSAVVVVPDVKPDVYYLNAVAGNAGIARIAFEVTAPSANTANSPDTAQGPVAKAVSTDLWNGFSSEQVQTPGSSSGPATEASGDTGITAGLALVGIGAAGIVAGVAVSTRRRQTTPR